MTSKRRLTKWAAKPVRTVTCREIAKISKSYVHDWCDGAQGPIRCEVNVTRDLQSSLDKEQKNLEALKDKRRDLDDKRSHASDDQEKSRLTPENRSPCISGAGTS